MSTCYQSMNVLEIICWQAHFFTLAHKHGMLRYQSFFTAMKYSDLMPETPLMIIYVYRKMSHQSQKQEACPPI